MSSDGKRSGLGCLLNLVIAFVVLVLALAGGGYIAVMHTALPFKVVASLIESGSTNVNLRITGISGSISSGFGVKSIRWTGGTIGDVRVKYSGFRDLVSKKELILREVHVGQAHLDITDWKSSPASTNATPSSTSSESPLKLFQIDRLTIQDVALTNRLTGFSLAMPALEWTGFKAVKGHVEFGQLKVDSDRLKIATKPARSAEFQKLIEGTLLPKLHPLIRRPISFIADVGYAGSNVICRVSAFDGKLDFEIKPDQTSVLRCKGLDLADYFDAPLPQDLTAELSLENGSVKVRGGTFKLGVRTFEIQLQDASETNIVVAVSRTSGEEIRYELVSSDQPSRIQPRLTAKPPLNPQDTLAKVFYGKLYSELTMGEQADVTRKLLSFTSELKR
jgi:hypothetical protein